MGHTLLRTLIDDRGWNGYRTFLAQWRVAAAEEARQSGEPALANLSLSESTYERWYAGTTKPQSDSRRVLARLFGRPFPQLIAEVPPVRPPTDLGQSFVSAPNTLLHDFDVDLSTMGRQQAMAARRAMEFAMGAERNEIGSETLGYLQDEVRRIADAYPRVPLSSILDDLIHIQDSTFRLLEGGRAKPGQIRDLYLLAAIESGLMAKAAHDSGDPKSAMLQARTAVVCADQAEHNPMRAWVRGLQSLISYWADRPEDALHYARQGAHTATNEPGTVSIWLAGLEGRAAAALGDSATVHAATVRGAGLRDRTQPDLLDGLGGLFVHAPARQAYYEVEAKVLLGASDSSLVGHAEETVRAFADRDAPHWAYGDEAGSQTNLALAHLYGGDLEGAAEAVRPVLDLAPDRRNAGIIVSVQRVRGALMQPSVRSAVTARSLSEEIAAFSSHRPLALPR